MHTPTPTPWKFGGKHSKAIFATESGREICKVHYAQIGTFSRVYTSSSLEFNRESDANARLIVQAVNSHAALVAALEETLRHFAPSRDRMNAEQAVVFDAARAALALAVEGKVTP